MDSQNNNDNNNNNNDNNNNNRFNYSGRIFVFMNSPFAKRL